ncbi:MAG: 2-amino-4-hydroxy-6-hydroxymethyldihydropteridine diphosphokinase [Prevotellaceae bacterium]|jgi:2-amino-4-hydroxy-6-hydroxymethyldihydropteridine diphosphokinase|nr:2-amino-4-hydroxy-6-hydroxymethyldihydropteridine diphosphokinase [Prevotellaceae bacterium]
MPVFLLLGTNQGDRDDMLRQARTQLQQQAGRIIRQSSLYESEPWGFASPDWFLNQALALETALEPLPLLSVMQHIETALGRRRTGSEYASRPIDIDILLYDDRIIECAELTVPHPRMHERLFALRPLNEIAPTLIHPHFKQSIASLVTACTDRGKVDLIKT